jgi:hypothetical protein
MVTSYTAPPSHASRVRYRLLAVAVSVIAALAVWGVAFVAGAALEVTSPLVGTLQINALIVIAAALPLAFAAWAVLALLERRSPNARRIWTIIAVAVLVVTLAPLAFLDATLGTKVALASMHIATGLVLIFMLRHGARAA